MRLSVVGNTAPSANGTKIQKTRLREMAEERLKDSA